MKFLKLYPHKQLTSSYRGPPQVADSDPTQWKIIRRAPREEIQRALLKDSKKWANSSKVVVITKKNNQKPKAGKSNRTQWQGELTRARKRNVQHVYWQFTEAGINSGTGAILSDCSEEADVWPRSRTPQQELLASKFSKIFKYDTWEWSNIGDTHNESTSKTRK